MPAGVPALTDRLWDRQCSRDRDAQRGLGSLFTAVSASGGRRRAVKEQAQHRGLRGRGDHCLDEA
jgi:hypothetical protein